MKLKTLFFTTALLFSIVALATPPVEEGKAIFSSRCAACHNINKVLTGPALAGIHERRSMDWIIAFIQSSQSLVKAGDKDAVAIYEQFNKMPMPDHPDLNNDHIKSIVEYIKVEGSSATEKAPFAKPSKLTKPYTPLSINNYGFFLGYLALVGVLIAVLLLAVRLKQYERSVKGDA